MRPRCGYCAHRNYGLTCDEYDHLAADHGGRCFICGSGAAETAHGFLVIDHDGALGYWAVRGLLCSRCNTTLGAFGRVLTPAEDAYLADPWWRRHFARIGCPAELRAEPPVGAVAVAGPFRWTRTKRGWERPTAPMRLTTWPALCRLYGPRKLQVADAREIRKAKGTAFRREG